MRPSELTVDLLVKAYASGYFPMPDQFDNRVCWYRPDPRALFELDGFHVSRNLKNKIKKSDYRVAFSTAFRDVMRGCADRPDTWISTDFVHIYSQMHRSGLAHSVEIYREELLIGGSYGVCLGGVFFAESMFHRETDASKLALYHLTKKLQEKGFAFMECQFMTPHLKSLGAIEISDFDYQKRLEEGVSRSVSFMD